MGHDIWYSSKEKEREGSKDRKIGLWFTGTKITHTIPLTCHKKIISHDIFTAKSEYCSSGI
jgi:hypothetical protein